MKLQYIIIQLVPWSKSHSAASFFSSKAFLHLPLPSTLAFMDQFFFLTILLTAWLILQYHILQSSPILIQSSPLLIPTSKLSIWILYSSSLFFLANQTPGPCTNRHRSMDLWIGSICTYPLIQGTKKTLLYCFHTDTPACCCMVLVLLLQRCSLQSRLLPLR